MCMGAACSLILPTKDGLLRPTSAIGWHYRRAGPTRGTYCRHALAALALHT